MYFTQPDHSTIKRYLFILSVWLMPAGFMIDTANAAGAEPSGVILTWQQDPTTTMTIDWHTPAEVNNPVVHYRRSGNRRWQNAEGESFPFPFAERIINRVELTGLNPDTEYEFRMGEYSAIRKFKTIADHVNKPLRFAAGGDVRHEKAWMERVNRHVARYSPEFIVWGGDLAYADGLEERLYRWDEFLDAMAKTLITPEGLTIPVVVGVGNHEVVGGYYYRNQHDRRSGMPLYEQTDAFRQLFAPYFFSLFAFPGQPGYNVLDFGDYLSIIMLDSDHANPIEGKQTLWLDEILQERKHVAHVIPVYHVPAYPSVRDPESLTQKRVRDIWVPMFEQYPNIRVAFEHHDHIYKRTYPIRNNQIDPTGITYIGDGAWGVRTRRAERNPRKRQWYLKRTSNERHAIIVTLHGNQQHFLIINEEGEIIDEYPATLKINP